MPFLPDEPTVTGGRFLDDAPPAPAGGRWLDEPETAGTLGGIANSFQRGRLAGQRAIEAIQFTPEGATPRQHRRAFVGAMEDPNYLPRLMEAQDDPAALGRIESLYGPGRRVDAITDPKRQQNIATAQNVAGLSRDINALPPGAALQEWAKADNSNWWKILAGNGGRNFLEIGANIIAESLPQASASITAGMAGGAAGGPVGAGVGAGTGSFAVEAANSLLEGAQRAGVDLTNPEQVRAFFTDETKVKAARQFAMQRGFPIALFDALTAGVAGKFLKPALGQGMARVAGASGLELGTQMAGGAAGETAAQVASGQPLSARDIAAEAIGELVTAPGEVASNLRTEAAGAPAEGGIAGGHFIDEPGSVTKRAGSATSLQPSPKPADVSPDALASLQASLRGESPESPRLKGAVTPKPPESVPSQPDISTARTIVQPAALTEEQRAAMEFQRKTDEAVQQFVENPDKDYSGLSRLELELLDGMGDARAKAEMYRRRNAKDPEVLAPQRAKPLTDLDRRIMDAKGEIMGILRDKMPAGFFDALEYQAQKKGLDDAGFLAELERMIEEATRGRAIDIKPTPEERRVRQAQEEAELDAQAMQAPKPREAYAGVLRTAEAGDSLITAAREAGGVNAPPLEDALQRMEAGEAPAKIVAEWARGGGEADALASVLEQIGEAARRGRQFAEFKDLAAAYRKAFTESTRNKTDLTLSGLNDAREMGLPVKVPESTNELIDSVWSEATASRQPELSPQEAALHFNDVLASNRGRTKEQNGGTPVETGSLVVGDTFAVHGVQMRVAGIDADTDAVTLEPVGGQNPEQFGARPVIDPQQAPRIYPDFGTYRRGRNESESIRNDFTGSLESPPGQAAAVEKKSAPSLIGKTGLVPPRYEIKKPITGPTGAQIVGYEWRSTMGEKWSNREGGYVDARVSDWDNADESKGTGRQIVHVYYVKHPDGRTTTEGIRSAQNVLGISETKLQTIAKKAQAEQAYAEQQEKAHFEAIEKSASDTQADANRKYRVQNHSPMRSFEENQAIFEKAVLYEKDGKFVRTGTAPERMESKGWKPFEKKADAVESALDSLKIDVDPSQLHAFGLLPEMWNGLIEAVRLAYRGGKSIAAAIEDGLAWLKATHGDQQFDETAVRAELKNIVAGPGLRSQLNNLGAEMAEIEARGEPIPQEMLERYKDLADTLGDEIRSGKASAGAGRVRVDVDRNLQPGRAPAAAAPNSEAAQQRRPTSIPQFRGPERLPRGRMRDLFTGLKAWRERVGNWLSRRESRMDVTVGRDAADNRAAQVANEASMHVRLKLNRAFDTAPAQVRVKHELREAALTFVVEADGDRSKLSEFYDTIASSDHADTKAGRQALAALEYAETHWDKLQPAAAEYRTLTETEREAELNEGVNSHEWRGGYVYHRWDKEAPGSGADPTQPRPAGTPFRKSRSVATYAEGIAQGRKPQTLNALELLSERVASGQRRMNELSWVHGLRNLIDPVTDEPVVVDVIRKPRKPVNLPTGEAAAQAEAAGETYKPEFQSVAPEGYNIFRFGDLEVAVQEGFGKLMTALTAPSYFKGNSVKKVFGFVKSALLLFDTFHLGRMVAWRQMFGLGGGYQKGQTLLDFTPADIREMAERGEIPAAWTEGLLENKRRLALGIRSGFNIGSVLDNSWGDALHHLPGIGTFNKWLFGQYQRGAMAEAWLIEFERLMKGRRPQDEAQVARRVSRDLNSRFGNLNRQGLFKSRTAQDLMRFLFLAPQWNESLIRSELGAIGQALKMPLESWQQRRIVAGTLMRATGLMAVGTFLANQILNYAFRGKPTWENEEEGFDKKISAYIPDAIGNGPGFFLNPLALPAEYTHLIEGNLHRSGGDWSEAFLRIFNSRLHSISRAGSIFVSRRDVLGQKLRDGEVLPAMAKAMIPVPIAVPSVAAGAKQLITGEPSESYPGQFQKQMMASFGVKTDQAPNAEQRIRNLARAFNDTKGIVPNAEFFAGDFDDFTKALRMGNQTAAREALEELLKKKTARQVYDHYKRWAAAPFTGQRGRESEFWRGLSAEQRTKYQAAREARRKLALEAAGMLRAVATSPAQ